MSNDLWRWADPDGQQRNVRLDELRAALAEGRIAPNTPVWRSGWKGWQPAHEVAELTSASLSAANGVVLNIPPPPLAMVAVQEQYEAASTSIAPAPPSSASALMGKDEEPPPPPAYVPVPAKPPSGASLKTQLGGSAFVPAPTSSRPGASVKPPAPGSGPKLGPSLPTAIGLPPPPALLAAAQAQRHLPGELISPRAPLELEELSGSMLLDSGSSPNVGAIGPDGMPPPTNPILHEMRTGTDADISTAGLPRRLGLSLILDDIAAIRQGRQPKKKLLLGVLCVVGLSVVVMLIAGIVSIASGTSASASATKTVASASGTSAAPPAKASATAATPTASVAIPPPPPAETTSGTVLGDCTVSGDAKLIAPRAVIASGIEPRVVGSALAFGFAATPRDAVATMVDASSLAPTATVHAKPIGGDVKRVTPTLVGAKLAALPDVDRKGDHLGTRRVVAATSLIDIGTADGGIVWAPHGKDSFAKLFTASGDGSIEALRATSLGPDHKGIALTFRQGNAVHVGVAKGDAVLDASGSLSKIAGLGQVGSPAIASSGDQVVVAWADRTGPSDEWKVRWAKMKAGNATDEANPFTLPEGGLGGAAMSPSVAPLGGGRFLLAWTEGPVSGHQVRAITIGADGSPSGAALAISAPGVNAGQPAAVVGADGRGAVAFVAAKGKALEVHATPISCPPR